MITFVFTCILEQFQLKLIPEATHVITSSFGTVPVGHTAGTGLYTRPSSAKKKSMDRTQSWQIDDTLVIQSSVAFVGAASLGVIDDVAALA